jgi:TP901 family phage tail tape measure protein
MSDFNILIGVDLTDAESDIKGMINRIGENYPIKLQAVLANKDELLKDIESVTKLLNNLKNLDINLNLVDIQKGFKEVAVMSEKIGSSIDDAMGQAVKKADKLSDEIKDAVKSADKLMRITEKERKDRNGRFTTTVTKKVGDKFRYRTETKINDVIPVSREIVRDFQALEQHINKITKQTDKWVNLFSLMPNEIVELTQRLGMLHDLFKSGDFDSFDTELKEIEQLTKAYDKLENSIKDRMKAIQKLENQLKKTNLSNLPTSNTEQFKQQIELLKQQATSIVDKNGVKVLSLDDSNFADELDKVYDEFVGIKKLNKEIGDKQKELNKLQEQLTNTVAKWRENAHLTKKEIDSFEKSFKNIDVFSDSFSDNINAVREKLLELASKEEKIAKEKADKEKAQSLIAKEKLAWEQKLEDVKRQGYAHSSSILKLERLINELDKSRLKNLEQVKRKLEEINKQYLKIAQQTKDKKFEAEKEKQINNLNTMIKNNLDADVLGVKEVEKFKNEVQKLSDVDSFDKLSKSVSKLIIKYGELLEKQELLNKKNTISNHIKDWEKQIQETINLGYVNESDFSKVKQMMDLLSAESKTLKDDLKAVQKELENVIKESNRLQANDNNVRSFKEENNSKINQMAQRGVVPEHLINNFKQLNESLDFYSDNKDLERVSQELKKLVELEEQLKQHTKTEESYRKLIRQAEQEMVKSSITYLDKITKVENKLEKQVTDEFKIAEINQRIVSLKEMINSINERGFRLTQDEEQLLKNELRTITEMIDKQRQYEASLEREKNLKQQIRDKFESVSYRATRGFDKNIREGRILNTMKDEIAQMIEELQHLTGEAFTKAYDEIQQKMNDLNTTSRQMRDKIREEQQSMQGQLVNALNKVPVWISAMTLFYGGLHQIQQGFEGLLNFDKAMVNLQKVTEATNKELEDFKETALQISDQMGITADQVVNATAEFQKLGYSLQQATQLGKNTLLYANVGDMEVEDAQQHIVSTIKGFGIEVDKEGKNVQKIVDIFNEVGNNFAISSSGIGEALRRSSAVLKEAGNTLEEAVAMAVSANSTIQDPERVGTSLKTISMRLRGMSEEGEELGNFLPELEAHFNRIGLTLRKNDNTFKSTYEIFDDLSKVWNNLSDMNRASLVELIGGKEQGAVVSAMISNWADARKALNVALNSEGSAMREFQNYMEGFEYKIGRLKSAVEEFWMTLMNSEGVKNAIDALTKLVEVLTKLVDTVGGGTVVTQFLAGLLVFANPKLNELIVKGDAINQTWGKLKDKVNEANTSMGKFKNTVDFVKEGTMNLGASMLEFIGGTTKGLGGLLLRFGGLMTLVWAVSEGVNALYKWLNQEKIARQEKAKTLEDEITKTERLLSMYQDAKIETDYLPLAQKVETEGVQSLSNEEYVKYVDLQNQIAENMPELIAKYDEHGKAVLKDAEAIRELIRAKEENLNKDKLELTMTRVEDEDFGELEKQLDKVRGIKNQIDIEQTNIKGMTIAEKMFKEEMKGLEKGSQEWESKLQEVKVKLYNSLIDKGFSDQSALNIVNQAQSLMYTGDNLEESLKHIEKFKKGAEIRLKEVEGVFEKSKDEMNKHTVKYKEYINEAFANFVNMEGIDKKSYKYQFLESFKEQMIDNLEQFAKEDVKDAVKSLPKHMKEAMEAFNQMNIDWEKLGSIKGDFRSIEQEFENLKKGINSNKAVGEAFIAVLDQMKNKYLEMAKQKPIDFFAFNEVTSLAQGYISEVTELESAYRTLADGEKLSLSNIMELITKYPELTKHLKVHNGQLELTAEGVKHLMEVKEEEFKTSLKVAKAEAQIAQQKAKESIEAMLKEAEATKLLADLKTKSVDQMVEAYMKQLEAEAGLIEVQEKLKKGENINAVGIMHAFDAIASKAEQEFRPLVVEYKNLEEEINAIDKLLKADWKIDIGSTQKDKENKKEMEEYVYIADKYKLAIEALNYKLTVLEKLQEKLAKHSKEYRKAILDEIKVLKEKKRLLDEQAKSLEKQIRSGKIQRTGVVEVDSTVYQGSPSTPPVTITTSSSGRKWTGKYADIINKASRIYGVDPFLIASMIRQESNWNPRAKSWAGARGLMQLMPATARELGVKNPYDPYQNIMGGTKYIAQQLKRFGGDVVKALIAYNAGAGNVYKVLNSGEGKWKEPKNYVRKILGYYNQYTDGAMPSVNVSVSMSSSDLYKRGSSGDMVRKIQKIIGAKVDGIFGAETERKLKEWQKKHGLKADGIAGYNTLVKMGLTKANTTDKNDNPSKERAEAQQAVDQAKQQLLDLKEEAQQVADELQKLYFILIESNVEHFKNLVDSYEDDIGYVDYMMEMYDEASKGYRDYANVKLKYLKQQLTLQKQHLAYLEKEKKENKNLTQDQKTELNNMIREQRLAVYEVSQSIIELQTTIAESSLNEMFEKWSNEMEEYERNIDYQNDKIKFDIPKENNPNMYRDELQAMQQILALQRGQKQDIIAYIKYLEQQQKKYKDNHQILEMITAEIEKWRNELESVDDSIKETKLEIRDLYEKMADEFVEIYKEQLRLMQEAEDKAFEDRMKQEDKAHQQKMKNLDKELEKIRKVYEEQMRAIDRDEEKHDFEFNRNQLQKEISEIQEKINVLKLDDSYEAQAKRKELEKQLTEKQIQLAEMEHDREVELRKQNLEDDLRAQEEAFNNQKEIAEEEYEHLKEMLEKEREERQKYWENVLNDERKFRDMRKRIMIGEFDDALSKLQSWKEQIEKETGYLGDKIKENFTDRIVEAIQALTSLQNINIGGYNDAVSISPKNKNAVKEPQATAPSNAEKNLGLPKNTPTYSGGVESTYRQTNPEAYKKPSTGGSSSNHKGIVEVVTDTWLFKTPNESASARIRMLKKGEQYKYYGEEKGMYILGGGYASKKHLRVVGSSGSGSSSSSGSSKRWRTTTDLNLRSQPSYDGKVITVMPKGARVEYLGMENGWAKIKYNGKVGYAGKNYIEQFKTGGYTGEWGSEGKLAILHEKELVLNKEQTKDILTTAKIMERIKNILPKINLATMQLSPVGVSNVGGSSVTNNYEYNVSVHVENMNGDKNSADIVASQIMQKIKRIKGGRF